MVARTIFTVWGFGHQGRLVHHLGSILILDLYKMVPGFVPQVGFCYFFVRTGFYTFDKKPFPANFISQNQKAACLEPSGWSNMQYYLTGLLLGKDLFSQALSPSRNAIVEYPKAILKCLLSFAGRLGLYITIEVSFISQALNSWALPAGFGSLGRCSWVWSAGSARIRFLLIDLPGGFICFTAFFSGNEKESILAFEWTVLYRPRLDGSLGVPLCPSIITKVCSLIPQQDRDVFNHTFLQTNWNKCACFWFPQLLPLGKWLC